MWSLKRKDFISILILLVYAYYCYLMFMIVAQYIPYNTEIAFLNIKQDVIQKPFYKLAFFTHVYTSLLVLPAGFIQFNVSLRIKFTKLHRMMGWVYVLFVLLLVAPSGFWMGVYANGGISSQIAFCLLSILWFLFTLLAINSAIQKQFQQHRDWMIRSFALTLSAITLRAWKTFFVYLFHPHPMDVYRIVAWLGWVLNLLVAEMLIRFYLKTKTL